MKELYPSAHGSNTIIVPIEGTNVRLKFFNGIFTKSTGGGVWLIYREDPISLALRGKITELEALQLLFDMVGELKKPELG